MKKEACGRKGIDSHSLEGAIYSQLIAKASTKKAFLDRFFYRNQNSAKQFAGRTSTHGSTQARKAQKQPQSFLLHGPRQARGSILVAYGMGPRGRNCSWGAQGAVPNSDYGVAAPMATYRIRES